jgi:hypothetical protein
MGNFLHFTMGALVLVRAWVDGDAGVAIPAAGGVYALFAVAFGAVLFTHPASQSAPQG